MMPMMCGVLLILLVETCLISAYDWSSLNLPESHIPYYFTNHPHLAELCTSDEKCPYKDSVSTGRCFGYEDTCTSENQYMPVSCPEQSKWVRNKKEQIKQFWESGDFGIISDKKTHMTSVCTNEKPGGSVFECELNARYCRGKNIVIDLRKLKATKAYDIDFLNDGSIGGECKLNKKAVMDKWERSNRNALQSWYHIPEQFESMEIDLSDINLVIDKPTYFTQNDAVVNMFHHFCDFVNLYVTQHLNSTTFDMDNQIITWETTGRGHNDPFQAAWNVFTQNPVSPITKFIGKKILIKEVIFALPPRQRLGLFYNMPLVPGCYGTGLFRAFNEHFIHRLGIKQEGPMRNKIRISVLSRGSKYRNILNQDALVAALNKNPNYEASIVEYGFAQRGGDPVENFMRQIKTTHNTDIFVGMHGAGLTHMLFLPHWAAVFELYHCDDAECYSTLARLRGVKYLTWSKMDKLYPEDEGHHPTLGAHKKFTNYEFDEEEFVRLIDEAADHVKKHKEFRAARKKRHAASKKDEL